MFYKNERLALFVDGLNFHSTIRALDFDVDYKRLLEAFQIKGRLLRASYFTPLVDTDEHVSVRPLLDWMQYNGWNVVTKPAKVFTGEDGRQRIRGSTDIEMTVAMVKLASTMEHAVLFTGNGDFTSLVGFLQERGIRVTVISSTRTQPSMMSDELRRQADMFVELDSLRETITKAR